MALDFAAGCLGGAAGVLVGYPLDTVKVHIQTDTSANKLYKGTFDCLRKLFVSEGIHGLYRGMSSPLGAICFINAIVFGVYGNIQRRLPNPDSLAAHTVAGVFAGLAQAPICSVMELAKTRLQLMHGDHTLKGPVDCLRTIYRLEGLRGVFKGTGITICREVPGFSSYFLAYEFLIRTGDPRHTSFPALLTSGGVAGCISWTISYPLDIIKSRFQADGANGAPKYSSAYDCFRKSVQAEGYKILFRGLNSALVRAFPMNGMTFVVVDWTFRVYEKLNPNKEDPEGEFIPKPLGSESITHFRWFERLWKTPESLGIVDHHYHRLFEIYGFH